MIYVPLDRKPPSIEERANIMRRNISKGGVPVDYDRLVEYYAHSKVEQNELGAKLLSSMHSNDAFFSKATFKNWAERTGLTIGFNLTNTGRVSYNDDSLSSFINTAAYGDEVTAVAELFRKYNYFEAQVSAFPNIMKMYPPTGLESEDGRRVVLIKPDVVTQNTGRFGLTNPAFMNLPRYMKDLVVAPKGWTIMSADSGQIEPKLIYGFYLTDPQINKLIEVYGDAYFAVLHYCRMSYADIERQVMDFTPVEITDDLVKLRKQLKTYGNGVMYGATSNKGNDPLKAAYIERIGQHPLRIQWQKKLEAQINAGQRLFPTLFGTQIDIYQSEKYKACLNDADRMRTLIHCAINNPIQGTAGDLMGISLEESDKLLSKKAPYSWITKYVHDEGQYCIYNEEKDEVMEELSGHTSYNIGGLVKIFNEPKVGRKMYPLVPTSYQHLLKDGG